MQVQDVKLNKVGLTGFGNRKLRLSVKSEVWTTGLMDSTRRVLPESYVAEYSNPESKILYQEIKKSRDFESQKKLCQQMEHPYLKNVSILQRLKNAVNYLIMYYFM